MSKKYRKPPVIEVLCEFQFEPDTSWDLTKIGLIYEEVKDTFPKRLQLQSLPFAADAVEIVEQTMPLMRFQRSDDLALIQVAPNFLAVNHLKPYPSWKNFLLLIEKGLNAYRKAVDPTSIRKVSLRYINRIEVPSTNFTLEKYFQFRPFLGSAKLHNIAAFTIGVQIPFEDDKDTLSLQLTSLNNDNPNLITMLLDLNYFLAKPEEIGWNTITQWLHIAHNHIEETFEECITEELRKTFEGVVQ